MSTIEIGGWRRFVQVKTDWRAVALALLFLVVISGALAIRPLLIASGTESAVEGASSSQQAAVGAGWAIAEATFAGLLVGVILVWRKLPEWVQEIVTDAMMIAGYMMFGVFAAEQSSFWSAAALIIGLVAVMNVADHFDVWWIANNLLALGLAIFVAGVGIVLGPWVLAVGLIGLSLYDYWFADRESWMFTLGSGFLNWKVPVLFVIPKSIRLDWDELTEAMSGEEVEDEDQAEIGFGIGTADLALPAAFVVALAGEISIGVSTGIPIVAVTAGILVACARVSWKMANRGGGAGLPPLTSGAIGGWVIGAVIVAVIAI